MTTTALYSEVLGGFASQRSTRRLRLPKKYSEASPPKEVLGGFASSVGAARLPSARARGFTLVEVLIATGILAMISTLIYSAFASMNSSKEGVSRANERSHEGREALRRMARELQSAYISKQKPFDTSKQIVQTAFVGKNGTPADRVDFNSFCHRRLDRDSHESDQAEISYYGSPNPKDREVTDLVRREDASPDMDFDKGGRVDVLAEDIDLLELKYLEPLTGMWVEQWDSTQALNQPDRVPLQVRIVLVLNGGRRASVGRSKQTMRFVTKVSLMIRDPLTFALE